MRLRALLIRLSRDLRVWILAGLSLVTAVSIWHEARARQQIPSEVVISEFMAANVGALLDEDGDASDWIELQNRGTELTWLEGYALTDEIDVPAKWPLPAMALGPGESIVVFASAKDRRGEELHTNFVLDAEGELLALTAPHGGLHFGYPPRYPKQWPDVAFGLASGVREQVLVGRDSELRLWIPEHGRHDAVWMLPQYDDSAWQRGVGSVGFETGYKYTRLIDVDLRRMHRRNASVYLRIPFELGDATAVERLVFEMKYEDGFVAYLNGKRVASSLAPKNLRWRSDATDSRPDTEAQAFTEIELEGWRELLVEGTNLLAIHGLNASKKSADFLLLPVLRAFVGSSTARHEPRYLEAATPGGPNRAGFERRASPPALTVGSGIFVDSVTVGLERPETDSGQGEIRYTLDGSEPTAASSLYIGPVVLERSTRLRARHFAPDRVPSTIIEGHYVLAEADFPGLRSNLPIVVLETFGPKLDDEAYVPAFVQIFSPSDFGPTAESSSVEPSFAEPSFAGPAASKYRGSTSLLYPKKSIAIELRDGLGRDAPAPLLGLPADSDWALIAPYQYDRSLIRNALVYELARSLGRYAPRTRFVELYLHSGDRPLDADAYHGVYVLTEKIGRGHHRVDVPELLPTDLAPGRISGGYILKIDRKGPGERGLVAGGLRRLAHVEPKEARIHVEQAKWIRRYLDDFAEVLEAGGDIEDWIDIGSFVDYHLIQEFTRNPDGHRYSTFVHKGRGGKLRMGPVWDFDRAMGADSIRNTKNPPDPRPVGRSRVYDYGWWQHLMENPELHEQYRERWLELRMGPLRVEEIHRTIDRMAAELSRAHARNFERWPIELGQAGWPGKIEHLRQWIRRRALWLDTQWIGPPIFEVERAAPVSGTESADAAPGGPEASRVEVEPAAGGEIFYTLDGRDPRAYDGTVVEGALPWKGALAIETETLLTARERVRGELWGALGRRVFVPPSADPDDPPSSRGEP